MHACSTFIVPCYNVLFQHRCVSIFKDKKTNQPSGFALGSIEGRVAIHFAVNPANPKDNFTFKCHRSNGSTNAMQDIYAVSSFDYSEELSVILLIS